ncbi:MAG TPA: hypothetical protein VIO33_22740 [Burkholderiaceae bacterium]
MAVLLLKAAMPMLASAAAQAQGKALVEVCTTYGVSLMPLDGSAPDPDPGHSGTQAADHCALTALPALVPFDAPPLGVVARASTAERAAPVQVLVEPRPDAAARWAAQLEHGPPVVS